jgi:hypothetical protein
MMIHDMISRYYFVKPSFLSFVPTINKPLFFREGVGIGDMSYIGQQVYQTKVDQKKYTIQTFE